MNYETVEAMKLASPVAGERLTTQGYYAAGDGGGASYFTSASATADGYGILELANGVFATIQHGEVISPLQYGLTGDDTDETHAAVLALRDSGIPCDWGSKTYRLTDRVPFLSENDNLNWRASKATIKLNSATAEYAFYIPAVGDGDLEVAGASGVVIDGFIFDGTLASSGVAGVETWNAATASIANCESNNWGLSGCIIKTTAAGETDIMVSNYRATGNTNHGLAVATLNEDASRVIIDGVWSHGNGLGIDISTGSATVSNVSCWDNTNGGIKTAGNDDQHLIISNADLSNNTNAAAQGFYTNGTFKLLEMSNIRCFNNGNNGFQIAHAGEAIISNLHIEDSGATGYLQSGAADVLIENLIVKGSTGRGVLVQAGTCMVGKVRTENNDNYGVNVTTTEDFSIESLLSIDDCLTTNNAGLFLQGAGRYHVDSATVIDTGAGGATIGVSTGSSAVDAFIGSIRTSGVANAISDSGTDTVYLDAMGDCRLPPDKIGFFAASPVGKQSITGSKGSNAALTSLLDGLELMGLITDSTT